MATRVGIELSPAACRIVEIDDGPVWRRVQGDTRVRSFAVLPPSGPELREKLESLRRRHAAIVVWTGRSEHRQVMVTAGSYESMRAEALASLAAAGLPIAGVWADIAPASPPGDHAARRPVVVSMASAAEVSDAIRPIREAGIRVRTVTTPAVALGSLARKRQAFAVPGSIEAYVALDEQVTCIALVRSGVLLAARDLPWGYVDRDYAAGGPRSREDMTALLSGAVGEFVAATGGSPGDIGQVCVCGGLPDLRSMSAALMEQLDVEVEPLDSLFGIDAARLPEPADEFRERGAELRLAWAAAADWPPPINLLRARRRQVSKTWLARAAVVAGAAAGLGGSWWIVARSGVLPPPSTKRAANTAARARGSAPAASVKPAPATTKPAVVPPPAVANKAPATPPPAPVTTKPAVVPPPAVANKAPVTPPPAPATTKPAVVTPPPVIASKAPVTPPPAPVTTKPVVVTPPPVVASKATVTPPSAAATPKPAPVATKPAVVTPPPTVVASKPPITQPPRAVATKPAEVAPRPVVLPPPAVASRPVVVTPPVAPERPAARTEPAPAPPRAKPAAPAEVALPFDAVLGTILYSPDRKLAIIDNRIVGVGDEVRGARVTEITANAVFLRDAQGKLRRLALGAGGR